LFSYFRKGVVGVVIFLGVRPPPCIKTTSFPKGSGPRGTVRPLKSTAPIDGRHRQHFLSDSADDPVDGSKQDCCRFFASTPSARVVGAWPDALWPNVISGKPNHKMAIDGHASWMA
jgi:hypothetical protein